MNKKEIESIIKNINEIIIQKNKDAINEIASLTLENGFCATKITENGEIKIIDNLYQDVMHEMVDIKNMSPEELEIFLAEEKND